MLRTGVARDRKPEICNKCLISKQNRVNKREIYKSLYLGKFQYPNNNSSVNIYRKSRSIHPNHVRICIGWRSSSGLIPSFIQQWTCQIWHKCSKNWQFYIFWGKQWILRQTADCVCGKQHESVPAMKYCRSCWWDNCFVCVSAGVIYHAGRAVPGTADVVHKLKKLVTEFMKLNA